jgi:hypothetical protein
VGLPVALLSSSNAVTRLSRGKPLSGLLIRAPRLQFRKLGLTI